MNSSNEMPDPILITGCARSGTSMAAGVLNICGAFGGVLSGPNKNNPKGMFENTRIRNTIVKPHLRSLRVDEMGQYPLPKIEGLTIPYNWGDRVRGVLQMEGYQGGPWMYKGAKMCLIWPIWQYAFPDAKWLIIRRKSGDIITSCKKTSFMRAFLNPNNRKAVGVTTEDEGWLWWIHQHEERFVEMLQVGLNAKVIWPQRMVAGDYSEMFETLEWLGLEWKTHADEIYDFVDPKLWKARL